MDFSIRLNFLLTSLFRRGGLNAIRESKFDCEKVRVLLLEEYNNQFYNIAYSTPQQSRDGLFHSRTCFEQWHLNHRNEIERLIRDMGEWKNPS